MSVERADPSLPVANLPFESEVERVFRDPAASYWLKNALSSACRRDPVDALVDAVFLMRLLEKRVQTLLDIPGPV